MIATAWIHVMRWFLTLVFAMWCAATWAQNVGSVVLLNGTLSAQSPDGNARILLQKSAVLLGDTLSTQRDSYAQINFTDGSSATLRPNTAMKIEQYYFDNTRPHEDSLFMRLLKGGLRSVTGLIGKRGNQDAYKLQTTTAVLGIRGTSGETMDCMQGCEGVTSTSGALAPGVYHTTLTGIYDMSNRGGSLLIAAGQFGFTDDPDKAPVLLDSDPGLGLEPFPFTVGAGDPVEECVAQ